jgi:hypothetical protein
MIAKEPNRWNLVKTGKRPANELLVQLVVEKKVVPGMWVEYRKLWFVDNRPVFPTHWRPMADLPRGLK